MWRPIARVAAVIMRAGVLDQRVVIWKAGLVEDSYGDQVESYTDLDPIWASRRAVPGSERVANAQNGADAPVIFRIRWRADLDPEDVDGLNPKDRVEHPAGGGRIYDIKSVMPIGRREAIEIIAVARAG